MFCFLDNLTLTVKLLIFVRVTPIDSHRLNMFAKYMLPLLLVCSTICEKLSYEEILQAAKAGEIQDSGPTAPVKTELVLDGRMAIYMFLVHKGMWVLNSHSNNVPIVSFLGLLDELGQFTVCFTKQHIYEVVMIYEPRVLGMIDFVVYIIAFF